MKDKIKDALVMLGVLAGSMLLIGGYVYILNIYNPKDDIKPLVSNDELTYMQEHVVNSSIGQEDIDKINNHWDNKSQNIDASQLPYTRPVGQK